MKKLIIFISGLISILIIIACILVLLYSNGIKAVSKKDISVDFEVVSGNNYYNISSKLYESGLIKSEFWYKVYLKLNKVPQIKTGI